MDWHRPPAGERGGLAACPAMAETPVAPRPPPAHRSRQTHADVAGSRFMACAGPFGREPLRPGSWWRNAAVHPVLRTTATAPPRTHVEWALRWPHPTAM